MQPSARDEGFEGASDGSNWKPRRLRDLDLPLSRSGALAVRSAAQPSWLRAHRRARSFASRPQRPSPSSRAWRVLIPAYDGRFASSPTRRTSHHDKRATRTAELRSEPLGRLIGPVASLRCNHLERSVWTSARTLETQALRACVPDHVDARSCQALQLERPGSSEQLSRPRARGRPGGFVCKTRR